MCGRLGVREGNMEKFTTLTAVAAPMPMAEHRHRQGHPGALPQDHQALGPRRASVRPAALRQRGQGTPGLHAEPGTLPPRADHHRAREFRLRLLARARAVGAAGFRHPLHHRAGFRRHLLQQQLQERHAADPPAARDLRRADRGCARWAATRASPSTWSARWWCGRTARRSTSTSTRSASICC